MSALEVKGLSAISMICADLDRTQAFYRALGFVPSERRPIVDAGWHQLRGTVGRAAECLRMRLGAQTVEFVRFDPPGAPYPPDSTSTDLWFQHIAIVVADLDAAHARLGPLAFTPISRNGPERLPPSTGGVGAFKFRDPDGHPLELLHFPSGVGDACWHEPAGPLFRGIDHSAIAVGDAAASIEFYGEVLGLTVGERAVNHGPEQERLDDLPEDVVDVIPLRPRERVTPHVELLGYRIGTRRPQPLGSGPADIAATWMIFEGAPREGVRPAARGTMLADGRAGTAMADPDGHRLILLDP